MANVDEDNNGDDEVLETLRLAALESMKRKKSLGQVSVTTDSSGRPGPSTHRRHPDHHYQPHQGYYHESQYDKGFASSNKSLGLLPSPLQSNLGPQPQPHFNGGLPVPTLGGYPPHHPQQYHYPPASSRPRLFPSHYGHRYASSRVPLIYPQSQSVQQPSSQYHYNATSQNRTLIPTHPYAIYGQVPRPPMRQMVPMHPIRPYHHPQQFNEQQFSHDPNLLAQQHFDNSNNSNLKTLTGSEGQSLSCVTSDSNVTDEDKSTRRLPGRFSRIDHSDSDDSDEDDRLDDYLELDEDGRSEHEDEDTRECDVKGDEEDKEESSPKSEEEEEEEDILEEELKKLSRSPTPIPDDVDDGLNDEFKITDDDVDDDLNDDFDDITRKSKSPSPQPPPRKSSPPTQKRSPPPSKKPLLPTPPTKEEPSKKEEPRKVIVTTSKIIKLRKSPIPASESREPEVFEKKEEHPQPETPKKIKLKRTVTIGQPVTEEELERRKRKFGVVDDVDSGSGGEGASGPTRVPKGAGGPRGSRRRLSRDRISTREVEPSSKTES